MEENKNISKEIPKRKKNVGCGIVLIIMSLGALRGMSGSGGDISYNLGVLTAFGVFLFFGIRMIIGKEIKEKNEKHD